MNLRSLKPFSFLIPLILVLAFSVPANANPVEQEQIAYTSSIPSVNNTTGNVTTWSIMTVTIALVFSFGLLAIGIATRDFFLKFISGIVWVFSGVFIYVGYSVGWLVISVCVGLYFMLVAGFDYQKERGGI